MTKLSGSKTASEFTGEGVGQSVITAVLSCQKNKQHKNKTNLLQKCGVLRAVITNTKELYCS